MTNHPNRNPRVFGLIKVAPRRPEDGPLHLHFSSRDAYEQTLRRLGKAGREVTDHFWGYTLYNNSDEALLDVEVFIR
jgi:hypothetical protein